MINYQISKEDLELIRKFDELKRKGYYCDSMQLTTVYNRVLNKHVNNTVCASCMRQRISELVDAANRYEQKMANEAISSPSDSVSEVEPIVVKEEENKELTEAEIMKERMAKVRAARKSKK